jgi:hypothetical protein
MIYVLNMQIMYHNDENLLLIDLMYIYFTKAGLYSEEIQINT